jgi:hypothetical protein
MNTKNILILLSAILVLFAVLLILLVKYDYIDLGSNGNGGNGKFFDFKETDASYYEYMYDDPGCRNNICMKEYIVHSNGIVFSRDESVINGSRKTKINTSKIEKNKAEYLIAYTGDHMQVLNPEGIDCQNCGLVHIFYGDTDKKKSATSYMDISPQFMSDVLAMTELELKNAILLEPFFVHVVFSSLWKNSADYHFYSDGTVLKEEFGEKNGELLGFNIYTIEKSVIDELRNSINKDHFLAKDNEIGCVELGLKWGYIELQKDGEYNFAYTCGVGDSAVDKLFKELFEKTGGK